MWFTDENGNHINTENRKGGISKESLKENDLPETLSDVIEEAHVVSSIDNILSEFEHQPESLKEDVNEMVFTVSTNDDLPIASADTEEGVLKFNLEETLRDEKVRPIVEHELEHFWLDNLKLENPEKFHRYFEKAIELKPFVINLEMIKNKLTNAEQFGTPEEVERLKMEYVDEVHSETAENLSMRKHGLDQYNVTDKEELEKSIELYKSIHEEAHEKRSDLQLHQLSKHEISYLEKRAREGHHIGFVNLADIVFTGELKHHPRSVAGRIAIDTAADVAREKK